MFRELPAQGYDRVGMSAVRQSPLRMLAPLALGAFAVVFLIVVVSSLGGDSSSKRETPMSEGRSGQQRETSGAPATSQRKTYVVKSGDTLSKIAARTGVEIERLLTLNPTVDPQGLVTGQRIKLRE